MKDKCSIMDIIDFYIFEFGTQIKLRNILPFGWQI